MHRMLCIQSCGKPAHTGAFAPNHVLMFVQNPAFGYCAPPCVDEEKGLSRVKVFRTPRWLLVRKDLQVSFEAFLQQALHSGVGFRSGLFRSGSGVGSGAVPGRVLEGFRSGFRSRLRSGFWSRFRSRFRSGFQSISAAASGAVLERVPSSLRPKPLCQALQDAWSPKTRAYSVLCLMQS